MVDDLVHINKHFDITAHQQWQLDQIVSQHRKIATKQNLISHGDVEHLWIRHILHSMLLTKVADLSSVDTLLDIGTGGGFPSLPLGVLLPEVSITAIDGRSRKTNWVNHIRKQSQCENVTVLSKRAEDMEGLYDAITARAVAPLHKLVKWSKSLLAPSGQLFFFKGGDFRDELRLLKGPVELKEHNLYDHTDHPFFQEKYILELSIAPSVSD